MNIRRWDAFVVFCIVVAMAFPLLPAISQGVTLLRQVAPGRKLLPVAARASLVERETHGTHGTITRHTETITGISHSFSQEICAQSHMRLPETTSKQQEASTHAQGQ